MNRTMKREKHRLTPSLADIDKLDISERELELLKGNAAYEYIADVILVDAIADSIRDSGGLTKLLKRRIIALFSHGFISISGEDIDGIVCAATARYRALRRLLALNRRN